MGTNEGLNLLRFNLVLGHRKLKRQRLPAVRISKCGPGQFNDQRIVHRRVGRVVIAARLPRSIAPRINYDRSRHPVPYRRRRGARDGRRPGRIPELGHLRIQSRFGHSRIFNRCLRVRIGNVTRNEHLVGRIADRLMPRIGDRSGRHGVFIVDVSNRHIIIGRPSIIHRHGYMKEIAGVNGRIRKGKPDGIEILLIPAPRHGLGQNRAPGTQNNDNSSGGGKDSGAHDAFSGDFSPPNLYLPPHPGQRRVREFAESHHREKIVFKPPNSWFLTPHP